MAPFFSNHRPVIIDLFAGVGGLSLGAARAGFNVVAAVENDPQALQIHTLNFPSSLHLNRDVSTMTGGELLNLSRVAEGELDGLIGGPPCQGFSTIGLRDVGDERNELFGKFFQLVAESRPKFFLAENVPNILSSEYGAIVSRALAFVEKDYFCLPAFTVKANDYGAPTSRERALFIGVRRDLHWQPSESDFAPEKDTLRVTVKHALKGLPRKINPQWLEENQGLRKVEQPGDGEFGQLASNPRHVPLGVGHPLALKELQETGRAYGSLGTRHTSAVEQRYAALGFGKKDRVSKSVRLDPEGYCPTLRAGTSREKGSFQAVRPIHPT